MRRILNHVANSAMRFKGRIFAILYRSYALRLGRNQNIDVIAHRLCRLVWKILHQGVHYEERGPVVSEKSKDLRNSIMIQQLSTLGYGVEQPNAPLALLP